MSYQVLVIPEDPTHDRYILKPLVERLLREAGKPQAKVSVMTNPRAQGYSAIKARFPEIFENYRHLNLMLFLPDRDCHTLTDELEALERSAEVAGCRLLTCAAIEEVEVWLMAGHMDRLSAPWSEIRVECDPKERYFQRFLQAHSGEGLGDGRQQLMQETLRNFNGLLERCPELKTLLTQLSAEISTAQENIQ